MILLLHPLNSSPKIIAPRPVIGCIEEVLLSSVKNGEQISNASEL